MTFWPKRLQSEDAAWHRRDAGGAVDGGNGEEQKREEGEAVVGRGHHGRREREQNGMDPAVEQEVVAKARPHRHLAVEAQSGRQQEMVGDEEHDSGREYERQLDRAHAR